MERGENEGAEQEERKEETQEEEEEDEAPGETAEAEDEAGGEAEAGDQAGAEAGDESGDEALDNAEDEAGVTALPVQQGGAREEPSNRDQPGSHSNPGQSGSDSAFTAPHSPVQEHRTTPIPPNPSLHLFASPADGEEGRTRMEEEEEEEEEELIVLDPEHPLMTRFQKALKDHLNKQLDRLNLELREKAASEKVEAARRVELGVELYDVQQELGRIQGCLERHHDTNTQAVIQRRQTQEQLDRVREQYSTTLSQVGKQRSHVSQLQSEVDSLATRLLYTRQVNSDLRSDIAAMANASRKADTEKTQAEDQKCKQDLYVERLTKHMERLTEEVSMYEVQTLAQAEDTRAAKDALAEAQMEMDSLAMERKHLLQQWNSTLVGMRKRDEAFTTMQEALSNASHQLISLDTEIQGFKKSITSEEERNELLTGLLNRAQLDGATFRKLLAQSQAQQEALQAQYSSYLRMLKETEQTLARLSIERGGREAELTSLRKQMEGDSVTRRQLEDSIMSKLQEQLALDSTAKYSQRLTRKMAAHKRDIEAQMSHLENKVAGVTLEVSETSLRLEGTARVQAALEEEIEQRNGLLSTSEATIAKMVNVIERKQATISVYNRKIEQIVASTGHEDMGPLEILSSTLSRQLEEVGVEIKEHQQFWLRQQGELVSLAQERQRQSGSLRELQTQLTILQQRKVRTEGDIQQEHREQLELERHTRVLQADMLKLNSLLSQNRQLSQALEQGNSLMETHYLHKLKEAERESVNTQMRLEKIKEEKERLLNSLIEAERQIMLWEKKTQLVRETRAAVDSEVGQGDIRIMRTEIHRMEVRYSQLARQQEALLRDMEAVVARRESVVMKGEAQGRSERRQPTHSDLHSTLLSLRRKIQDTQKQAEQCDRVIQELQERQAGLSSRLRDEQLRLGELQGASTVLTSDLQSLQDTKERNLARLVCLQGRAKQLEALRGGRYRVLSAGAPEALEQSLQRQGERLHAVASILQRATQESPQHQGALRRVSLALAARLHAAPRPDSQ